MQEHFIHQVYFWLANPDNQEDHASLLKGLKNLTSIPNIVHFHIGEPAATRREVIDSSYSLSWLAIFKTAADQDSYQEHTLHLEFVSSCGHLWNKVVVYDSIDGTNR
jgi:hypothetical protein